MKWWAPYFGSVPDISPAQREAGDQDRGMFIHNPVNLHQMLWDLLSGSLSFILFIPTGEGTGYSRPRICNVSPTVCKSLFRNVTTTSARSRRRQLGPSVHAVVPISVQKKGLSHSESNTFMPRGSLQAQAAPLLWLPGKDIPAHNHTASPAAFPLTQAPWLATTSHPKAGRGNKPTWNWDKLTLNHHTESPRALSACSSSVKLLTANTLLSHKQPVDTQ